MPKTALKWPQGGPFSVMKMPIFPFFAILQAFIGRFQLLKALNGLEFYSASIWEGLEDLPVEMGILVSQELYHQMTKIGPGGPISYAC